MKLYHYSAAQLPTLMTKRVRGELTEEQLEIDRKKAIKFKEIGSYADHISFFFDPISPTLMAEIYGKSHKFWYPGHVIYEHVIDTDAFEPSIGFDVVESRRKTAYFDEFEKKHNWVDDDPALLKLWVEEITALKYRWGEMGHGLTPLHKQIRENSGGTDSAIRVAQQRPDWETSRDKYAANVPHVMIYPTDGIVKVIKINQLTLGSLSRKTILK